jgi:hypothetical protein
MDRRAVKDEMIARHRAASGVGNPDGPGGKPAPKRIKRAQYAVLDRGCQRQNGEIGIKRFACEEDKSRFCPCGLRVSRAKWSNHAAVVGGTGSPLGIKTKSGFACV